MIELILITFFVFISAYIDYEHLKDNDYIESHNSRTTLRVFVLTLINTSPFYGFFGGLEFWTTQIGLYLFFAATFDNTLNMLRFGVKGIFHLGNTAHWDIFWKSDICIYRKKYRKELQLEDYVINFNMFHFYKVLVAVTFLISIYLIIL